METVTLWRPVGQAEMDLIEQSGVFPPRLPGQPIFYPVLNRDYAVQIARDWNTKDAASGYRGYVTEFDVDKKFLDGYEVQVVGGRSHQEYWIPADDLAAFNEAIVGGIRITDQFGGSSGDNPIYIVTGPPGAGKTTFCGELMKRYQYGLHIPVDDLRLWVVAGLSDSIGWSGETDRQFEVAEEAMCQVARTYWQNGFAVAIDHCRNIPRLNHVIEKYMSDLPIVRVCLLPELDVNISRNANRKDKEFDPNLLEETIKGMHPSYQSSASPPWIVLDSGVLSPGDAAQLAWQQACQQTRARSAEGTSS